jgi:hypothetical protein
MKIKVTINMDGKNVIETFELEGENIAEVQKRVRQYCEERASDYRFEIFAPGGERVPEKCVLEGDRVIA